MITFYNRQVNMHTSVRFSLSQLLSIMVLNIQKVVLVTKSKLWSNGFFLKVDMNSDISHETAAIFFSSVEPFSKAGYWLGICHGYHRMNNQL